MANIFMRGLKVWLLIFLAALITVPITVIGFLIGKYVWVAMIVHAIALIFVYGWLFKKAKRWLFR